MMSCHYRGGGATLQHRGIPLGLRLKFARLRVFACGDITDGIDVAHTGTKLLIDIYTRAVHHGGSAVLREGSDGRCTGTHHHQLTGNHFIVVSDHANDGTNSATNTNDLSF